MRSFIIAAVLACGPCVVAQTSVPDQSGPKPPVPPQTPVQRPRTKRPSQPGTIRSAVKPETVPPTTPVVTLQGVCKTPVNGACSAVITREELDRFVATFGPDVSESARGRLAVQYARTVAFSTLAELEGVDKNPVLSKELDAQLKLLRSRILSTAFVQNLEARKTVIAESEIQKYYDEHRSQYEVAHVRRVAVPVSVPTESGRPLDSKVVKAEMAELRSLAVAGEDLNQLQQAAYEHLHIQVPPPQVASMEVRRGGVQGEEATVLDLNPGEITPVLDSIAAVVFLKLESKDVIPFATAHREIEAALKADYVQGEINKLTKNVSAQFNLPALGLSAQPDVFGPAAIAPAAPNRAVVPRPLKTGTATPR